MEGTGSSGSGGSLRWQPSLLMNDTPKKAAVFTWLNDQHILRMIKKLETGGVIQIGHYEKNDDNRLREELQEVDGRYKRILPGHTGYPHDYDDQYYDKSHQSRGAHIGQQSHE